VLEARRHRPQPIAATDVSVVLDLMIHDIDLVLELRPGFGWLRLAAVWWSQRPRARSTTSMPPSKVSTTVLVPA